MLTPLSLRSHIDACSLLLFSTLLSLVYAVLAGGYCTCRSGTHSHRLEVTNVSSFFSYCRSVLPFHPRPILKARLQTPFMLIISVLIFIHLCAGNKVHATCFQVHSVHRPSAPLPSFARPPSVPTSLPSSFPHPSLSYCHSLECGVCNDQFASCPHTHAACLKGLAAGLDVHLSMCACMCLHAGRTHL